MAEGFTYLIATEAQKVKEVLCVGLCFFGNLLKSKTEN